MIPIGISVFLIVYLGFEVLPFGGKATLLFAAGVVPLLVFIVHWLFLPMNRVRNDKGKTAEREAPTYIDT